MIRDKKHCGRWVTAGSDREGEEQRSVASRGIQLWRTLTCGSHEVLLNLGELSNDLDFVKLSELMKHTLNILEWSKACNWLLIAKTTSFTSTKHELAPAPSPSCCFKISESEVWWSPAAERQRQQQSSDLDTTFVSYVVYFDLCFSFVKHFVSCFLFHWKDSLTFLETLKNVNLTTCAVVSWMWQFPVQLFTLRCENTDTNSHPAPPSQDVSVSPPFTGVSVSGPVNNKLWTVGDESLQEVTERGRSRDLFLFRGSETVQQSLAAAEMAQQENQLDRERFCCSICLDLLKDPVTTGCGHSYCRSCINTHWDNGDQRGSYSCPQCRQTFTPRPVLVKNTMLADLVEELKKTGLQAAPADHCYAGPEDVACDVCTGRKLKALKSCLVCLASYCEKHLQPHLQSAPLKKHKLVEPSEKLQENICSRHDEVMKMFCRTDQQCICYLCSVEEHKDHDTVSAAAERTERQRELGLRRQTIQQRVQDTEKDVKLLQQEEEALNGSADKAVKDSEKTFTEMIQLMKKRSSDVKQQIRSQQQTEVRRVRELQERLEQEITELKRRDHELKQLSDTEDHNQFLHNYPSLSPLSESTHSSSFRIRPLRHFEDVAAAVSQVRGRLQDILSETGTETLQIVSQVDVLLPQPEPQTRAGFLRYSQEITLDPNTVNRHLLLSEGNRKVTYMSKDQSYSNHPDRFTDWGQVLSRESLTGRCYWEVEVEVEVRSS